MTEKEIKEFFSYDIHDRFEIYWKEEIGDSAVLDIGLKNKGSYLPLLDYVLKNLPAHFYMYFNDFLVPDTSEYIRCKEAFDYYMNTGLLEYKK